MKYIEELIVQELNIHNPKLYPILDVTEPLLIAMNNENKWYLIYLLQHRRIRTKDRKLAPILEILVSLSDIEIIKSVALGEYPIRRALLSNEVYRIGKIGNKIFKKKLVEDEEYIGDKIPLEDLSLNPLIPNRVDLHELVEKLEKL